MKQCLPVLVLLLLCACTSKNKTATPVASSGVEASNSVFPPALVSDSGALRLPTAAERARLDRFEQAGLPEEEHFEVPASKPTLITGRGGTRINVDPADLETVDGRPVSGPIEVELRELFTPLDMMKAGVPATSDGRLLVSGGSYFIGMRSEGQELRIRNGRSIGVQFKCITEDSMQLFYGERMANGRVNWKPANISFRPIPWRSPYSICGNYEPVPEDSTYWDSLVAKPDTFGARTWGRNTQNGVVVVSSVREIEAYLQSAGGLDTTYKAPTEYEAIGQRRLRKYAEVYAEMQIDRLGWINCDRFYSAPERTDLLVRTEPGTRVQALRTYLVFKNINSLMSADGYAVKTGELRFANVPVGQLARLVAFRVDGEDVYAYARDLTIGRDQPVTLALRKMNKEGLRQLMGN